jgi:hypothetical protein
VRVVSSGREERTEEDVLEDNGLLDEAEEVAVIGLVDGGSRGSLLFNSRPG